MKKKIPKTKTPWKILVLVHGSLVPPENIDYDKVDWPNCEWETEYDVISTLQRMGHRVQVLGVISNLKAIGESIKEFNPHIVFNLLEEFDSEVVFDQNVVSYLELLKIPYTGCNPRGLMLARDKAITKKILKYHKIAGPSFAVFPKNRRKSRPKSLEFPLIVKCLNEEASFGLAQASIVTNDEKLKERVNFINGQLGTDAIAEQFIEGREFYCGVLGNYRLKTLPVWELFFDKSPKPGKEFYSNQAKFNWDYRERKGIRTDKANISEELEQRIHKVCKKVYKALGLSGLARIDLRVTEDGKIYVIEANPNPDIAEYDDFAQSSLHSGISYHRLLQKILSLGKQWNPGS